MNHIKPQYLGGFAILFWGFQLDLLLFAIPMAIVLEARYFTKTRWAFTKKDFYQIADLTGIVLLLTVIFLFLNRREYHFITTLLSWIPILIYPLVVILSYSTTSRMTLDVLFYSLRRQSEPVNQSWDMDYILLGACLLAAGLNRDSSYYFPIAALVVVLTLYQLRSTRWNKLFFVLSLCLVLFSASVLHTGIRSAHLGIKAKTEQLIARWISRHTDPLKTHTALGQVGQLKLSDAIAFRIEPLSAEPDFPRLLQEAAYNSPTAADWEVFDLRFQPRQNADDYRWEFAEGPQSQYPEAKIYIEFDRTRALVPVPAQLTEIYELPATFVKRSVYGTIQATGLIPAPHYRVRYQTTGHLGDKPSSTDLVVPTEYHEFLDSVVPEGLSPGEAIAFVQDYFADFRYTLYQSGQEIQQNPLIHFMRDRKAGHCEYFASATAIMLRKLGIPSRYVVGYAIQEWNEDLSMYIVRERHAHAWAIAFVNDRWVVVDTTPSEWLAIEEDKAGWLQPLWDRVSNNWFLFLRWWNVQELEDYERELYIFGAILALILIWRISTSEQVTLEDADADKVDSWILPGRESPFFRIEEQLSMMGYSRSPGELMGKWLMRIERPELLPLLTFHNRWRFDPRGIPITEKKQLAEQVQEWLNENPTFTQNKIQTTATGGC